MTTVGTFNVAPEFEVVTTSARRAYTSTRDQACVRRRLVQERQVRTFALNWKTGVLGTYALIRDLWDLAGGVLDLDYTTLASEAIRVRFKGEPRMVLTGPNTARIAIELEEVL